MGHWERINIEEEVCVFGECCGRQPRIGESENSNTNKTNKVHIRSCVMDHGPFMCLDGVKSKKCFSASL